MEAVAGMFLAVEATQQLSEAVNHNNVPAAETDVQEVVELLKGIDIVAHQHGAGSAAAVRETATTLCLGLMQGLPHSSEVQLWCSIVLLAVTPPQAEYKKGLVSMGGIPLILLAMKNHPENPQVQAQAIRLLLYLSYMIECNVTEMVEAGGVEAVVRAMERHSEDLVLQRAAVQLLMYSSVFGRLKDRLIGERAVQNVLRAMEEHGDDRQTQKYGLKMLANLSSHETNKVKAERARVVEATANAMKLHRDCAATQTEAMRLLSRILADDAEACRCFIANHKALSLLLASNTPAACEALFGSVASTIADQLFRAGDELYYVVKNNTGPIGLRDVFIGQITGNDKGEEASTRQGMSRPEVHSQCGCCGLPVAGQCVYVVTKQQGLAWICAVLCRPHCASSLIQRLAGSPAIVDGHEED